MSKAGFFNDGGIVDHSNDESDEAIFEKQFDLDLNNDGDKEDQVAFDERAYLFNGWDLLDDQLAGYLNALQYDKMLVVMEPCFSGGFIADLRGENRVIVSASSEYELSYGDGPGNHDMFSYHFTAALAGLTHDGASVNADSNNDGKVSMLEAFQYATSHDTAKENPYYEDNGDGRGHKNMASPVDGDGLFGATFFLD